MCIRFQILHAICMVFLCVREAFPYLEYNFDFDDLVGRHHIQ